VVLRALSKDPADRFHSTAEFRAALERGAVGIALETITPPTDEREKRAPSEAAIAAATTRVIDDARDFYEDVTHSDDPYPPATGTHESPALALPRNGDFTRSTALRRAAAGLAAVGLAVGANLLFAERSETQPPGNNPVTVSPPTAFVGPPREATMSSPIPVTAISAGEPAPPNTAERKPETAAVKPAPAAAPAKSKRQPPAVWKSRAEPVEPVKEEKGWIIRR
jgi:hypothetical protein